MAKQPLTKLELTEAAIKRWESKLTRAMRQLSKLRLQRMRLKKKAAVTVPAKPLTLADRPRTHTRVVDDDGHAQAAPKPERPRAHALLADLPNTLGPAIREAAEDARLAKPEPVDLKVKPEPDLTIPKFLDRASEPDAVGKQIAEEIAARSKAKARGRIAKMKAKKAGDLKRMPLSGKAALAAIRESK